MKENKPIQPKILIVVPSVVPEGISKQVLLQAEALTYIGYDIKLLVLSIVDQTILKAFAPGLKPEQVWQLNQPDAYLSVKALRGAAGVVRQISSYLNANEQLLVFAHAPYAHFIMRLASLLSRTKSVRLWQYFHFPQYQEFPLNSIRRRFINNLNKWLAKRFDYGHISVSEAVKEDITQHLINSKHHYVIYNALPHVTQNKAQANKHKKYTIVVPGRLEFIKGQLWFLDAFKLFLNQIKHDDIQLIIVGGGSVYKEVVERINQLDLNKEVKVTGPVTNDALQQYMRSADLVVVPSFIEGLPLVLLEALQQQATVLASDIPSNKEVITSEKIGWLFKAGDVADCVAKLQFLYHNREQQLIEPVIIEKHLAANFSFEKHMQQLIAVINKA